MFISITKMTISKKLFILESLVKFAVMNFSSTEANYPAILQLAIVIIYEYMHARTHTHSQKDDIYIPGGY